MKLNNDKADKQITNYVRSNYKLVTVKPGKCRFNFKCHMNAVHEAKKHGHKKIALCVYIDGGDPIIHFINYKNGKFTDNTLGEWAQRLDYYFVKWIKDEEMWNVNDIFWNFKTHLGKQLSWWVRLTSNTRG